MDGFSYVDIFETKGLEYLLVIGFLTSFVLFWRLLGNPAAQQAEAEAAAQPALPLSPWFRLDQALHYHQGHSWALPEAAGGVVKVGIDDFAHKLMGAPRALDLPPVGTQLRQGEPGWKLQVGSESFEVLSPVSGEVIAVNQQLVESPEQVGQAPQGQGWLARVKASELEHNLNNLLSGRFATAWLNETEQALRELMSAKLGPVMQDGGEPMPGMASNISPDDWQDLVRRFLLTSAPGPEGQDSDPQDPHE